MYFVRNEKNIGSNMVLSMTSQHHGSRLCIPILELPFKPKQSSKSNLVHEDDVTARTLVYEPEPWMIISQVLEFVLLQI